MFGLKQHITELTGTLADSETLLNHMYICGLSDVTATTIELHRANCRAVTCTIPLRSNNQLNKQTLKTNSFRTMKNLNQGALCNDLNGVQWTDMLTAETNINNMLKKFTEILIGI